MSSNFLLPSFISSCDSLILFVLLSFSFMILKQISFLPAMFTSVSSIKSNPSIINLYVPFSNLFWQSNGIFIGIEGFDLIEETEVNIAGRKEICFNIMKEKDNNTIRNKIKESQEEIKEGSIKLELINYPKEIEIDQEFQVELRIDNQKFTKQKISNSCLFSSLSPEIEIGPE